MDKGAHVAWASGRLGITRHVDIIVIVLLVLAALAFGWEAFRSRSLIAAGLLCWVLTVLLPALAAHV